jgi:hypothetical protein
MAKQTITRRQKNISRLLREKKQAHPSRLKAKKGKQSIKHLQE